MLRITTTECSPLDTVLILEGRLVGPWVDELAATVRRAHQSSHHIRLNLSGLNFADPEGLALLRRLRDLGIAVTETSPFMQDLLGGDGPAP